MSKKNVVLHSFEVRNFKLFKHERLDLHPEVTVLVGHNDVGKSILLDAMYLYGRIQWAGFRGPLSDSMFQTNGENPTVFSATWSVNGEQWSHRITLNADAPTERLEHGERFWSWDPKNRTLTTETGEYPAKDVERFQAIAGIEASAWKLDTELEESVYGPLAVAKSFDTPPAYLFEPSALSSKAPLDIKRPDRSGFGWTLWLQEIINRRDDDLTDLEDTVSELFPFFGRVQVRERRLKIEHEVSEFGQLDQGGRTVLELDVRNQAQPLINILRQQESFREVLIELKDLGGTNDSKRVEAKDVSSGLLLALAHLALVYSEDTGSLLLLEEPENGLNSKITLQMMEALLRVVKKRARQMILTTHNSWWLDLVPPESIRVLSRDDEGAHIFAVEPERLEKLHEELEIYPSEVMSIHGPEGLLADRRVAENDL